MRFFLQLSYNGKQYSGWQRQENALSVQEILEDNLTKIFAQTTELTGCGRTDSGVHAATYYAHFDTAQSLPENFIYRINRMLPDDIAVKEIFEVSRNCMPDLMPSPGPTNISSIFIKIRFWKISVFRCMNGGRIFRK
ncbi:MAG: hypothetical protein IPM95_14370 [Sphingobacteriales bacterium]|nr:hypothetical protein [Sphingobacteriales bacterium]